MDSLAGIFARFLRFGFLAWGGPVAQIALMHEELVERGKWVSREHFNKVLGIYQALPGPEATELAVYFGYTRRGRWGGLLAGLGFMLPGFFLVLLLAWLYATYGLKFAEAQSFLFGLKAAVIGLILNALWRIGKTALKDNLLRVIAVAAVAVTLAFNANFVVVVAVGGLVALVASQKLRGAFPLVLPLLAVPAASLPLLAVMLLFFLKAGLLTFGGAYTVIPFLQEGAVREFGWISNEQFLDAIALSGLVPAPLVIVATFVGYLVAGIPGAVVATIGVFAPAFAFTLLGFHQIRRLMENAALQRFFEGLTAAVVGLIFVATVELARAAVVDAVSLFIALAAFALLRFARAGIAKVLVGAALAGYATDVIGFAGKLAF